MSRVESQHPRETAMHRGQLLKAFMGVMACPLCASIGMAEEGHHWSYQGETGPDKWGQLDAANAACSIGSQQSPIDIAGAVSARQPPLQLNWSKRPDTIVNNGHTIQLNFSPGAADSGGLAVVGALIVAGKANAVLNKIVSTMPQMEGAPVAADPGIDSRTLLPEQRGYYHYEGSLTTPPCSQTVDWFVLTHQLEAAEADIVSFAKLFPMNARPVQKLDRRFILSSDT
jgi:carbonic anhydrase